MRDLSSQGMLAAENTLAGALRQRSVIPLAGYVRIALEAAQPYEDEAHTRAIADRLEGQAMRVSDTTYLREVGDPLADAIDEAIADELEAGEVPDGVLLAQVAYMTLAQMLREGRL